MIVIAVGTGFTVSIIPNITYNLVKKDYKAIKDKINKSFKITLYITIPMVVGLSLLANPVWNVFYGQSTYGPKVFSLSIFIALVNVLLTLCTTILLTLKEYKVLFINLVIGLIVNATLDIPLIYLFNYLKLLPYHGAIAATILGNIISVTIVIIFLYKKYDIDFFKSVKTFLKILLAIISMIIVVLLLKIVIPFPVNRIASAFAVLLYSVVGAGVYLFITYKTKVMDEIFEGNIVNIINKKIKNAKEK